MHAASVHPEPGSNSRMFVFNLASASSNHFECYLSFSYFCLSCICSLRNFRVPFLHILYACTSLFVVQFSMTVSLARFADSFVIISQSFPFVNTFFKSFLTFFGSFVIYTPSCDDFIILPLLIDFVNHHIFQIDTNRKPCFCTKCTICYHVRIRRRPSANTTHQKSNGRSC